MAKLRVWWAILGVTALLVWIYGVRNAFSQNDCENRECKVITEYYIWNGTTGTQNCFEYDLPVARKGQNWFVSEGAPDLMPGGNVRNVKRCVHSACFLCDDNPDGDPVPHESGKFYESIGIVGMDPEVWVPLAILEEACVEGDY